MALAQAAAGVDVVGPSGMMDGQVGVIRAALDGAGHHDVAILAYSAKYASAFYGPFREAVDSSLQGDRRTYQQDGGNVVEGVREALLDVEEGADMVMVKPALAYLDVVRAVREAVDVPVAAYNISGEYAMVEAAAANGWIDRDAAILETLTSIRRAGADVILTYWAAEVAGPPAPDPLSRAVAALTGPRSAEPSLPRRGREPARAELGEAPLSTVLDVASARVSAAEACGVVVPPPPVVRPLGAAASSAVTADSLGRARRCRTPSAVRGGDVGAELSGLLALSSGGSVWAIGGRRLRGRAARGRAVGPLPRAADRCRAWTRSCRASRVPGGAGRRTRAAAGAGADERRWPGCPPSDGAWPVAPAVAVSGG